MVSQDPYSATNPASTPMLLDSDWFAPATDVDKQQRHRGEEVLGSASSQSTSASVRAESLEDASCEPLRESAADRSNYSLSGQPVKIDLETLRLGMLTELSPKGETICSSTWAKVEPRKKGSRAMLEKMAGEPMWLQLSTPDLGAEETSEAPARVKLFCHWCGSKRASESSVFCTSCGTHLA
eukprot:TRINITY_DN35836_c0_g1_i1.p1 TRINITY_DN35836_c0_g1~~TRINITY_DN35836_c0_g1_i1.p1  ORF type:complete len:182 (+),score=33.41 TRINITY_DN35836_c0_g1_i1:80-625(+)